MPGDIAYNLSHWNDFLGRFFAGKPEEKGTCGICEKNFDRKLDYEIHRMTEHDILLQCFKCLISLPSEILMHHHNHACNSFEAYKSYDKQMTDIAQNKFDPNVSKGERFTT